MREQLQKAWDRNRAWVMKRYGLTEEEARVLEEYGVIPLPNGEVVIGPYAFLRLVKEIKRRRSR